MFLTLAAYTAILVCPLPATVQLAGLLAVSLWGYHLWRGTNHSRFVYHYGGADDIFNQWSYSDEPGRRMDSVLVHQGYRSAALLILVLRDNDNGDIKRVPIWCDSVTPLEFSYLNLQLLFNTES